MILTPFPPKKQRATLSRCSLKLKIIPISLEYSQKVKVSSINTYKSCNYILWHYINNSGNLKYPRFLFNRVKELWIVTVPSVFHLAYLLWALSTNQYNPLVLIFHSLLLPWPLNTCRNLEIFYKQYQNQLLFWGKKLGDESLWYIVFQMAL